MKSAVDELIDELYEMVDRAWSLPLSGGRAVLDGEEVKQIQMCIRDREIGYYNPLEEPSVVKVDPEKMCIRDSNSRRHAATQLLSYSQFQIYKGKDKYIINDAQPEHVFFGLRSDIERLSLAQYFCELA